MPNSTPKPPIRPAHIPQEDWDAVDVPPITEEMARRLRPARETHPEIVEAYVRRRGPQKTPTKERIGLRLDRDVLDAYRATGPGWQSRVNDDLRRAVERRKRRGA